MKLHIRIKTVAAMTLALSLFLSACGTAASGVSAAQTEAIQEATETTAVVTEDGADVYSSDSTLVTTMESIDRDAQFTDRDLEETYEAKGAVTIDIGAEATDGTVTITEEGVYLLHGTLDGQIVVAAADTAKVQLVLDGVTMTNADGPCIFVQSADKVFLTLAEGSENSLADTGEAYVQPDAGSTVDGVVFSRDDLVLNGTGTLKVTANYANGIVSKDDLKITGGVILVSAAAKGVEANDSIRIAGGTIDIVSGDDGIHSDNAEDAGKGYIYICGGEITVKAGDDGIHAATALLITEGIIDVTESYEGLEGDTVDIEGGNIDIVASDDGINAAIGLSSDNTGFDAFFQQPQGFRDGFGGPRGGFGGFAGMDSEPDAYIRISGGTIHVDAGGDGLDSNGMLYIDGGQTVVEGPTNSGNGALDYGVGAEASGGVLLASGSAGMAIGLTGGTQYSLLYRFAAEVAAGTAVTMTTEEGEEIFTYISEKPFSTLVITTEALTEGNYVITAGDRSETITLSDTLTTAGSGGGAGQGAFY